MLAERRGWLYALQKIRGDAVEVGGSCRRGRCGWTTNGPAGAVVVVGKPVGLLRWVGGS